MHKTPRACFDSFQRFFLKTITIFFLVNVCINQQALGQLVDDFSDGDFTANPVWAGDVSKFSVVSQQLKLQAPSEDARAFLTTPSLAINNAVWEFYVRLNFNSSSTSYARVYLVSDQSDLTQPLNGYYVMVGSSEDDVSLYRQTGSSRIKIIDGTIANLNASNVQLKIKVTRDHLGNWELFSDVGLTSLYKSEGTFEDNTHKASEFFGWECVYIASRSAHFYLDDISITGDPYVDTDAPVLQSVSVSSARELLLTFSEALDVNSASAVQNYFIDNIGVPASAVVLPMGKQIQLTFSNSFPNGIEKTLRVSDLKDIAGNAMSYTETTFRFFQSMPVNFKDVVITEIFPDFNPKINLPEAEFVEIYNRSENPIDLHNWKLTDGTSTGTLSSKILAPHEYIILTSSANQSQLIQFGNVIGMSGFPSLNNNSDRLILKNPIDAPIDSVTYSTRWYKDEDKSEGGWTLELINPDDFCKVDDNWTASTDVNGGTPGKQNSVYSNVPDTQGPKLLSLVALDSIKLELAFDESLGATLPSTTDITINPEIRISGISFSDSGKKKLWVNLDTKIIDDKTYRISVTNLYDCPGNIIDENFSIAFLNLDTISPSIQLVKWISSKELELRFNERISITSITDLSNFHSTQANQKVTHASVADDEKTLRLTFDHSFVNGVESTLTIGKVEDINGNVTENLKTQTLYFEALPSAYKDIIITEIFPDPSPSIGLPEAEFVEIYNRSDKPFQVKDWTISDGSSIGKLSTGLILPKEYVILTTSSSVSSFKAFGRVISVSNFPSLNNSGDALVIKDLSGMLIDSINYTDDWYRFDELTEGGYTMELIDPENICAEETNWVGSEDESGGTPGKQNSVFANKPDLTGPQLTSVIALSATTLQLNFNEKLESVIPLPDRISINGHQIENVKFLDKTLKVLLVDVKPALEKGKLYSVKVKDVYDCAGNVIDSSSSTYSFGLAEEVTSSDLVINEVLFNPHPTGVDFIEVYNRSEKFINFKGWSLANFSGDSIANSKTITSTDLLLPPFQYIAFTIDPDVLKSEYPISPGDNFFEMSSMPSLSDDEGSIALVDSIGNVIDGFYYTDNMHSTFVKDEEGVSLERVDVNAETNNPSNWKSASSLIGFATPGYANSNSRSTSDMEEENIKVDPEIFLPVVGQPDFTQIRYNFSQGGYVANIKVYDPRGREIKTLADNEILGTEGFFRWDGDEENGTKARAGNYVILFEVFDDKGSIKKFMKRVAIAGRF